MDYHHRHPAGHREVSATEVLVYLDQVRAQFPEKPAVVSDLVESLTAFRTGQIDTQSIIERIYTIISGYPHLVYGLNQFLPQGYYVRSSDADELTFTTPSGEHHTISRPEV